MYLIQGGERNIPFYLNVISSYFSSSIPSDNKMFLIDVFPDSDYGLRPTWEKERFSIISSALHILDSCLCGIFRHCLRQVLETGTAFFIFLFFWLHFCNVPLVRVSKMTLERNNLPLSIYLKKTHSSHTISNIFPATTRIFFSQLTLKLHKPFAKPEKQSFNLFCFDCRTSRLYRFPLWSSVFTMPSASVNLSWIASPSLYLKHWKRWEAFFCSNMSHITRKPVYWISVQVRLKPVCSADETS